MKLGPGTVVLCAAGGGATCGFSGFAGFVSASWPIKGKFPELKKPVGKNND